MNREDFEKAARLSHLSFNEGEKESFIKDMTDILAFADTLCELDAKGFSDSAALPVTPLEKDEVHEDTSKLLAQSKKNDGTYVVVPSSID